MKHLQFISILILFSMQLFAQPKEINSSEIKARLYNDNSLVEIKIVDGYISEIKKLNNQNDKDLYPIVAPGLIDIQVNGYAGIDYTGDNLKEEDIKKSVTQIWKTGVTSLFPTIITHSDERIKNNFSKMAVLTENNDLYGSVPGFHLEGPYISPEDGFRGVHLKEYVRKPNWNEFYEYHKLSGDAIKLVTISPEYENAIDFIKKCNQHGIVVGMGHLNATPEQIKEAATAGAAISTHLGNGCANFIHRHNNILWPQLADDKLTPTIIADGHHLNQQELIVFTKTKGYKNVILISDLMYFAGLAPGEYMYEGRKILLTTDDELLYPEQKVLAGAATPLLKGVENMMRLTGCSLEEAVTMASTNPAKKFALDDRGEIGTGKRADLILFELNNGKIELQKTYVLGNMVYSKN